MIRARGRRTADRMRGVTTSTSSSAARGGKSARSRLGGLGAGLTITFRAKGHKSSESDGRTAADIRRELERNG